MDYHSTTCSETLKELKSNSSKGLTNDEADKRLNKYGTNELRKETKGKILQLIIAQFANALIVLLIFAGIISVMLGDNIESIAIFAIILLNAILGFVQEYKAEESIEALKKMSSPNATVLRNGQVNKIPASDLVIGDIVLMEAGDIVPADMRIIEASSLQIDEASLTGESVPVKKDTDPCKETATVSEQACMAFMGTHITYGKGKAVVVKTGMNTEFGKIASSLSETEETKTPLQVKFEVLAKQIGIIAIALIALVLITGTMKGTMSFMQMLLFSLVLAVSTIPSALPVVVTASLSMGANALAKKNMLMKKLPAAESLGAVTFICSDKTGTITKNEMTVTKIYSDAKVIDVSGTGYVPKGDFYYNGKKISSSHLDLLLRIGTICNNAKLVHREGKHAVIGDPTEGSLIVLAEKGNILSRSLNAKYSHVDELPFDSDRKRMSVIFKNKSSKKTEAYVKGAPDLLLRVCDRILEKGKVRKLTAKDRKAILAMNDSFAKSALRVLGFAYKDVSSIKKYDIKSVESNLIFVGIVGMIDPPREEVKKSIIECNEAGIKIMIITGDHAVTTKAIGEQIGLVQKGDLVITGEDLDKFSDKELEEKIEKIRIVARALPIQKLRIVTALQKKGHIVAMTGDGVNDAPAIKKADIGIAMGITGTDVAKEVSKAILVDDNFSSIVNAVEEGRNIYDKMVKSAKYLLACNSGEIFTILIAVLLAFPLPLLALQVLMINILTDSAPALGLGFEKSEPGIMKRKPRDPKENPISVSMLFTIILFGIIMALGTLFMFAQYQPQGLAKAQTVAFTTLVLFQLFAVVSSRSLFFSLKNLNMFTNMWLLLGIIGAVALQAIVIYVPFLQMVFGTVPLLAVDWLWIVAISSIGFISMEASKFFVKAPQ